jgi:outer membrane protein OmpA-like peptidoglycan-associated protein
MELLFMSKLNYFKAISLAVASLAVLSLSGCAKLGMKNYLSSESSDQQTVSGDKYADHKHAHAHNMQNPEEGSLTHSHTHSVAHAHSHKYVSSRDESQTLGFLKPGYKMPEAPAYKHVEEKKVVKKKHKVKKVSTRAVAKPSEAHDAYKTPVMSTPEVSTQEHKQVEIGKPITPVAEDVKKDIPQQPNVSRDAVPAVTVPTEQSTEIPTTPNNAPATQEGSNKSNPVAPTTQESAAAPSTQAVNANSDAASKDFGAVSVKALDFPEAETEIPATAMSMMQKTVNDLKANQSANVKIESYGYSSAGNAAEARRNSLQRAIKIRKFLIDNDIAASRISVDAVEATAEQGNKVQIIIQ